jgi:hypothetical protein
MGIHWKMEAIVEDFEQYPQENDIEDISDENIS